MVARARLTPIALGAGILLLTLWPQVSLSAARQGLLIWAGTLIPALYPYCFLSMALQGHVSAAPGRGLKWLTRALGCPDGSAGVLLLGWLGGNPTGAALTAIAAGRGGSRAGYLRLAWLSSACSPAFVLGALNRALPGAGWVLLASSWLGMLASAPLLKLLTALPVLERRLGQVPPRAVDGAHTAPCSPTAPALAAARTLLLVGCWVVLFSVLSAYMYLGFMLAAPHVPPLLPACLHALMEMAGGCLALAELPGAHLLPIVCFALTFGGLSIGMQALSLLRPVGIPAWAYLSGKAVQGALAALICLALNRAGAVEALARAPAVQSAPSSPAPALVALVLAVAAALLNRWYIAWERRA